MRLETTGAKVLEKINNQKTVGLKKQNKWQRVGPIKSRGKGETPGHPGRWSDAALARRGPSGSFRFLLETLRAGSNNVGPFLRGVHGADAYEISQETTKESKVQELL